MKRLALLVAVFQLLGLTAQETGKAWVYFANRGEVAERMMVVEQNFSEASIDRRARQGIEWQESDLPVLPEYIQALRADGLTIVHTSRWLNAVSVRIDENFDRWSRRSLPDFVTKVAPVEGWENAKPQPDARVELKSTLEIDPNDYGDARQQIEMIHGLELHSVGLKGGGMRIAILDAGFNRADSMEVFDYIRSRNLVLGVRDFVDGGDSVYISSNHGTYVWSIMGAYLPQLMIGTAPDAGYFLLRTEDINSETTVEEDNWVAGAEWADSAGADLINSSLGYTRFDNNQGYTYEEMDGNTTVVTRGADAAASKGILVVNSNGNYTQSDWIYMGAPADGDSVFSIGAVDREEQYALFSSIGPTYDGRLKPNVSALGEQTTIALSNGATTRGNGTSFSAPVICGMTASLWAAHPFRNNWDIMKAVEKSAHLAARPNNQLGYGIPNYALAHELLTYGGENVPTVRSPWILYPNPFVDQLNIVLQTEVSDDAVFRLSSVHGMRISEVAFGGDYFLRLSLPPDLPAGTYLLEWWQNGERKAVEKVIRGNGIE